MSSKVTIAVCSGSCDLCAKWSTFKLPRFATARCHTTANTWKPNWVEEDFPAWPMFMKLAHSINLPSALRYNYAFLALAVVGFLIKVPTACGADHLWIPLLVIQRNANWVKVHYRRYVFERNNELETWRRDFWFIVQTMLLARRILVKVIYTLTQIVRDVYLLGWQQPRCRQILGQ